MRRFRHISFGLAFAASLAWTSSSAGTLRDDCWMWGHDPGDSVAIQSRIDAVAARGGGTVRLAPSRREVASFELKNNVTFRNLELVLSGDDAADGCLESVPECAGGYPVAYVFGRKPLPAQAFYVRHADNVRFENVTVRTVGAPSVRPPLVADDAAFVGAPVARTSETFFIDRTFVPDLVICGDVRPFVRRATEDVANDIGKIFGVRPRIRFSEQNEVTNAIVIARGGCGWENYTIESRRGNVLLITGSDDRGAMFGLYRFSADCLGVDPFAYWSGLEPEKLARREWKEGISIRQGDPSFRFRGWFVNDEDFLNGFRPEENGTRKIDYPRYQVCFGPFLADRICETAVRAGFNLIIPASYVDILNPDEKRLVDIAVSRGLYLTMHHQEPVGAGALALDVHFPEMKGTTYASHPELWRTAWRTYVGEWAKVPDVIWQIGLRGRRDRPFWATGSGADGCARGESEGEDEDRRRAKLVSDAMGDQLEMICAAMGGRPFRTATQLWMEGADFHRRGLLKIPFETTIIFADNSPGLKFRPDLGGVAHLPEDRRHGLYCHLALIPGNHHCELVPPARTCALLRDARAKGARELVLFNVSNVRPFLYTLAAAGEMTRNLSAFDPVSFQRDWCRRQFGAAAESASRAIDLFFAAYETEFSRDGVSSYGSARKRAPLAILNDGDLLFVANRLLARIEKPRSPMPVASPYDADPDRLRDVTSTWRDRVNQDLYPTLADELRYAARASAQAASFRRSSDQAEFAETGAADSVRRQLFERIGYPAGFMASASACCGELALAAAAREEGNVRATIRHLQVALVHARERDALDRRYNEGQWEKWYNRNIIRPYPEMSSRIAETLRGIERLSSKKGEEKWCAKQSLAELVE